MKKVRFFTPVLLMMAFVISACSDEGITSEMDTDALVSTYVKYAKDDLYSEWQSSNFTKIALTGSSAKAVGANATGVLTDGQQVTIKGTGTYVIEGSLEDGQLIVDAEDAGTVRLIFNGVSITSSCSTTVFVKQADKTVITLEKGTENTLTDAVQYVQETDTDEPSAALYSKDDLTINGEGSLIVTGNYLDGIVGKDDLLITGGTIQVTAKDDGIIGRDLFAMQSATLSIEAGGDGIKASNDEDEEKGNIVLESGSFLINAGSDGVQAEGDLLVIDGDYNLDTSGGSPETINTGNEMMGGFGGGMGMTAMQEIMEQVVADDFDVETFLANFDESQLPEGLTMEDLEAFIEMATSQSIPMGQGGPSMQGGTPPEMPSMNQTQTDGDSEDEESDDESVSAKGFKVNGLLQIVGGIFTMDVLDDALHSDGNLQINGGTMTIQTGDDGIHADADVVITEGDIVVEQSYEGLEGINVTISGGSISLTAEDDGININGGSSEFGMPGGFGQENSTSTREETEEVVKEEESLLLIEDGYVYVNANGDGLDSNSDIKMTGGTVLVYGPTSGANGSLDYDGTFTLEGGTLIAAGSSGMAMGVSDTSTQKTMMMTFPTTLEAGTPVLIENIKNEQVVAVAPEKVFQTIVISTPALEVGKTYTLSYDGTLTGDAVDGYFETATYESAAASIQCTLENAMTYLDENGVTENQGFGGFGGGMPGGRMQGGQGSGQGMQGQGAPGNRPMEQNQGNQ